MTQSNPTLWFTRSPARRYALSVVSFLVALGMALLAQRYYIRNVELPLFFFGVAITAWYAGSGPAALSLVLSIAFFDFFFTEPRYTFYVDVADFPYFIVFICFSFLVAGFSAVRRRVEAELRQARDRLETEVEERTRQASLLNLTHDSIFVRNENDVITYWNRAAQELYGFAPEEAIGKRSHDLLGTVFPAPIEEIDDQLLRTGRWEGELRHTKANGDEVLVISRWALRRDERGRPAVTMETDNDITERKRARPKFAA